MMETNLWMLDDLQRAINAERLAEADAHRLAVQARRASGPGRPIRVLVADALRTLATILDGEAVTAKPTQRRLARVF